MYIKYRFPQLSFRLLQTVPNRPLGVDQLPWGGDGAQRILNKMRGIAQPYTFTDTTLSAV